ncbi:MAG: hypothetical protein ACHQFW_07805 [Chitinophagales bacterium]
MRRLFFLIFVYVVICFLQFGCKRDFAGEELINQAPETYTVVDTIIRFGDDRLESEVKLEWWGDDIDGFITGYEFTFDEIITESTLWMFTEAQDSTFILAPPAGEDSSDYIFTIRAIDNLGEKDPTPERLVIPVKNSPPEVVIYNGINTPVKSFPVLKFYWEGSDPDGEENLSQYELYINDTTGSPYIVDRTVSSVIFEAQNPEAVDLVCNVYLNSSTIPNVNTIEGLKSNTWNKFFIRAVDQSNVKSSFAFSDSVFVKKVNSNILLVNGYSTLANESFYGSQLISNGFSVFDTLQIFEQSAGSYTQQSADNITQGKVFDLFDVIVWFSNDANNSFSLAQKTTEAFFNSGGKMLMSVYISSSFDPLSNFLDFTPIASLVDPVDTTLILDLGDSLVPVDITYPSLQGTSIVGIVKPINLQIGAVPLYNATLTAKDNINLTFTPWMGNSIVIAKKSDIAGNTNFVISTLELNKLDGLMNVDDFFQKVLIDEFGL